MRGAILELIEARVALAKQEVDRRSLELKRLEARHDKLLDLYFDGGIDKPRVKAEQKRINEARAEIQRTLMVARIDEDEIRATVDEALALTERSDSIYREAPPHVRRLLNQAVFERLVLDDEWVVDAKKAKVFEELTGSLPGRAARGRNHKRRPLQGTAVQI